MSEGTIDQLRDAIMALEPDRARDAAMQGIEEGVDPLEMINQGIRYALDQMGERFASGNLFLPELMLAAQAADAAVQILEPELLKRGASSDQLGKVLLATVKGDIHDIGKNIVALLMKAAGFAVVDLGVDRTSEDILAAAREHQVDVIGLSALLTTTMPRMKEFVELLEETSVRHHFKIIVGGAPVTQEFADAIGADGYGADASRAVELTRRLIA
ncbi:MAG: cobalamin-dependent protein [Deltaproteobacteria bacterium]|nr:cobalamin-dependent protein [Deltaproteobacteria bacterium]MBW2071811.1 cobalamin-dependent protein [Deltaproteobacteria bacterium]